MHKNAILIIFTLFFFNIFFPNSFAQETPEEELRQKNFEETKQVIDKFDNAFFIIMFHDYDKQLKYLEEKGRTNTLNKFVKEKMLLKKEILFAFSKFPGEIAWCNTKDLEKLNSGELQVVYDVNDNEIEIPEDKYVILINPYSVHAEPFNQRMKGISLYQRDGTILPKPLPSRVTKWVALYQRNYVEMVDVVLTRVDNLRLLVN